MRRAGYFLAALVGGYVAGALVGFALVHLLSSNTHDKPVEAAMTAAFAAGPVGAILALWVAALRSRRS